MPEIDAGKAAADSQAAVVAAAARSVEISAHATAQIQNAFGGFVGWMSGALPKVHDSFYVCDMTKVHDLFYVCDMMKVHGLFYVCDMTHRVVRSPRYMTHFMCVT